MTIPQRIAISSTVLLASIVLCVVFWKDIIDSGHFDLHASCYRWIPSLIALHVTSDFFTGTSYVFISVTLVIFVYRLHLPFQYIFLCFGAFIIFCGVTHFIEIITTIWVPIYWLAGYIKAVTAIASVGTAILLPPLLPKVKEAVALARKSDAQSKELTQIYTKLEQSYYTLADSMPLLIWTCDAKGENRYFNAAWEKFTGKSTNELLNDNVRSTHISHEDLDRVRAMWIRAFEAKTQYEVEIRLRRFDGVFIWHILRAIPTLEHGEIVGWISTGTDIHKQKQNEQALREAKERQDTFLSMASHELKTPLTSMQLLISFLRREIGNEQKYSKAITTIESQCKRLVKLINDLLDTSRIQDRLALTPSTFDPCVFARSVIATVQNVTTTHVLVLSCVNVTKRITADKDRLEQVLVNLLTNAIKYSPEANKVHIVITSDEQCITFAVQDYGIGIAEENQPYVFDLYYRSIGKDNVKYSGLGIGLYIASEIVSRHKGTIKVESVVGEGSTFTFSLPLVEAVRNG